MALIEIRNLTKNFASKANAAAVNDLSLTIEENQFVTLLGPSGCGKTTTLRMLAGYITPDQGTISVKGRVISSSGGVVLPEDRGMGMVFQNYAVWPHKTVYENVVFGLKIRRVSATEQRRRVESMLELTGLGGFGERYPSQLSGGQQQRVALARSLVVEPAILMLDEPLSNLDAKLREKMRAELKQLQRRTGITFVYVTHDQAEALALSDRIAVMNSGILQQYGSPLDVYDRPSNRIVADFMGLINFISCRVTARTASDVTLDVSGTKIMLPSSTDLPIGSKVDLAVRPEDVAIQLSGQGLPGVIADVTFLGNMCEYVVTLEDGQSIRVQTHPRDLFPTGKEVFLKIANERGSIFTSA